MNSSMQRAEKVYVPIEQIRYISDQLLERLEAKMETTLPNDNDKIDASDDPIRREISLNLQKYLRSIVDEISYSIIISNMDTTGRKLGDIISESQTKYLEPFNLTLNESVRQKYQEWEDYSVQVSQIRQRAPEFMNDIYNKGQDEYLKQLDERINALAEEVPEVEDSTQIRLPDETQTCQTIETSIQQLYESIEQLPRLRQDITILNKWTNYYNRHNK